MNFIQKQKEPDEFTRWKETINNSGKNVDWDIFGRRYYAIKRNVLQSLLDEQGFVCCYCEQRLSNNNDEKSHIEHIKPKSIFSNLCFNYANMLASCEKKGIQGHCGHFKGDWYDETIFVSPLNLDCAEFFIFTSAGEIKPTEDPPKKHAAQETIDRLNLNAPSLVDKRKKMLDVWLTDFSSRDELEKIRKLYKLRDSSGHFNPFRACIDYILGIYTSNPSPS